MAENGAPGVQIHTIQLSAQVAQALSLGVESVAARVLAARDAPWPERVADLELLAKLVQGWSVLQVGNARQLDLVFKPTQVAESHLHAVAAATTASIAATRMAAEAGAAARGRK